MTESLTPQDTRPPRRARRRWVSALIAVGVLVTVVGLVWNLVGGSLFLYNADQAVERRVELGDERFTLQGAPIGCSITNGFQGDDPVVAFSVAFGGLAVDVVHFGDPAELFQAGIPVVLDGQWVEGDPGVADFASIADDGWYFASDRMRVKHDNDYINEDDTDVSDEELQARAEAQEEFGSEACAA